MGFGEDLQVALEWPEGGGNIGIGLLQMQADRVVIDDFHMIEITSHRATLGALRGRPGIVLDGELEIVGSHVYAIVPSDPFSQHEGPDGRIGIGLIAFERTIVRGELTLRHGTDEPVEHLTTVGQSWRAIQGWIHHLLGKAVEGHGHCTLRFGRGRGRRKLCICPSAEHGAQHQADE
jgi:hypothetical protein